MTEAQQKRQTAIILSVKELLSGTYKIEEGWLPNFVLLPNSEKVSRVNIMGVIVSKEESEGSVLLDDGSGTISLRSLEEDSPISQVNIGDPVILIGRPRTYGQEMYVFPEILKKLDNPSWIKYRKAELAKRKIPVEPNQKENSPATTPTSSQEELMQEVTDVEGAPQDKLVDIIKELDSGDGAEHEAVITSYHEKTGKDNGNKLIQGMLKRGELFEIKGKLKVLE